MRRPPLPAAACLTLTERHQPAWPLPLAYLLVWLWATRWESYWVEQVEQFDWRGGKTAAHRWTGHNWTEMRPTRLLQRSAETGADPWGTRLWTCFYCTRQPRPGQPRFGNG